MKFIKVLVLILALNLFNNINASAQTYEGCKIGNELYSRSAWFIIYYWTDPYQTCTVGSGWSYSGVAGNSTLRTRCTNSGGIYGSYQCPIDDYIPHMVLGISILGFVYIRRRNLICIV